MKYWKDYDKKFKISKLSDPIQCIKTILPYLWNNQQVNNYLGVLNTMKQTLNNLQGKCNNTQQRDYIDQSLNTLDDLDKSLNELVKDCKTIKQKGQSLINMNNHNHNDTDNDKKWIKFATNYHKKQILWELSKNGFISKSMQFLQNCTKQKQKQRQITNEASSILNESALSVFSSGYQDNSTMQIKKRIDFSSTNHNHFGSTEIFIDENKEQDNDNDDIDTLPRIQYNTDCDTSFGNESKFDSPDFTPKSKTRSRSKMSNNTNSSKLRKFQSLNIQYAMETDPNKKKFIKRQMDRYDAIT